MPNLFDRFRKGWVAFKNPNDTYEQTMFTGSNVIMQSSSSRPDKPIDARYGSEKSIINAIYTRIAIDVAAIKFEHVLLDENSKYFDTVRDDLTDRLMTEANIDQTARAFIKDICLRMFRSREGFVAVVPINCDVDPRYNDAFKIYSYRVGTIEEWKPTSVRVKLYNDINGDIRDLWFPKSSVAIIENPFSDIMNAPNSTLQRLIKKLNILDVIDEQSGSGKLDLIIQLPYSLKSDAHKKQAAERKRMITEQLRDDQFGIAYTDATERVTQLNRPIENNLMNQIEFLTNMVYSQLGLTTAVMDGTANEQEMLNYYSRTIEPIASAITDEFRRKFLSKTARTQGHDIMFFRDPFKLVPVEKIAEIADKFTRNEIMSSNEIRAIVGYKPSMDPKADELRNKNLNQSDAAMAEEQMLGEEDQYYEDEYGEE